MHIIRIAIGKFFRILFACYIRVLCLICGRNYVLRRLCRFSRRIDVVWILRLLGARIGARTRIHDGIRIQNALEGSCENLRIGDNVYVGPNCLFDLASGIDIAEDVAISAGVSLVTHADVGRRPLKKLFPREEGTVVIKEGAWIGVNSTILHGVTVGRYSVIGSMSLVNSDIPENCIGYGIPCKVVRKIDNPLNI